jgi:hypothetical protein
MSNLPHPLGDTNPDDLFYPGSPQVTAYDLPGPAGSRAVEFGEDGISAAVNRGLLALAKNDEYLTARLESRMAKPTFTEWSVSGGAGVSFVFSAINLFVGDSSYLPETQKIRDALISVLDADYNELLDPTTGDKVVVGALLANDPGPSIVGDTGGAGGDDDGFFIGGAVARFATVNPVTGAVANPSYTIPDGTDVVFCHGIVGLLDTLATVGSEHLMRDAFTAVTVRAAQEIHAATFVKDGSRKATGNFDLDGYNLDAVANITNKPGDPLSLISDDDLFLQDQYGGPFQLSEDGSYGAAIGGNHNTIIGAINGQINGGHWRIGGARCKDRSGSFIYTDGAGTIDYPDIQPIVRGEAHRILAGQIVATDTGADIQYLVVNESLNLKLRTAATLLDGDTIIEQHRYTGGAFVTADAHDLRWPSFRALQTLEMTVGSAVGADFTDLTEALQVAYRLEDAWVGAGNETTIAIKVLGVAAMTGGLTPTGPGGTIKIIGDGLTSEVRISGATTSFACNHRPFEVRGVTFSYDSVSDSTAVLFDNPGENSTFSDLTFKNIAAGKGYRAVYTDHTCVVLSNCRMIDWTGYLVEFDDDADYGSVKDCSIGSAPATSITDAAIIANADSLRVIHVNIQSAHPVFVESTLSANVSIKHCRAEYFASSPVSSSYFVKSDTNSNPTITALFNVIAGYRVCLRTLANTGKFDINFSYNTVALLHPSVAGAMLNIYSLNAAGGAVIARGNVALYTDDLTSMFYVGLTGLADPVKVDISDNDWLNGYLGELTGYVNATIGNNRIISPTYSGPNPMLDIGNSIAQPEQVRVTNNDFKYKARVVDGIQVQVKKSHVLGNKLINSDVAPNHPLANHVTKHIFIKGFQAAAPGVVSLGDRYILDNGHTGWVGVPDGSAPGKIAEWNGVDWDLVTPSDQTMVWSHATETWHLHEGAYPGTADNWVEAEATMIKLSDATIGEDWTCIVEDNYGEQGINFYRQGDLWVHASCSFNHAQDFLGIGYGNSGPSNLDCKCIGNRFIRVMGSKLWSALGYLCTVASSMSSGFQPHADISHNTFYYCGPQFYTNEVVRIIWCEGGQVSHNQIVQPRFGYSDTAAPATPAELIFLAVNPTICEGNIFRFEYGWLGGIDPSAWPYDLYCIRSVGLSGIAGYANIVNNRLFVDGIPKVGCHDFIGIWADDTAHGQISLNSTIGLDITNLSGVAFGLLVTEPINGGVYVGNLSGDIFLPLGQSYSTPVGPGSGVAVANRAISGAGVVTAAGVLPLNGIAAPINLKDELNV